MSDWKETGNNKFERIAKFSSQLVDDAIIKTITSMHYFFFLLLIGFSLSLLLQKDFLLKFKKNKTISLLRSMFNLSLVIK